MDLKVFISSTQKDLEDDYLPVVERGVVSCVRANAEWMRHWVTPHAPAIEACRQKIEEASHYLGVFCFFRGWKPPPGDRSITELEYDHARRLKGPYAMGIFTPREGSAEADRLRTRAEHLGQSPELFEEQKRFLNRVRGAGTVVDFDVGELLSKVSDLVESWADGGLLSVARSGGGAVPASIEQIQRVVVEDVAEVFERALRRLPRDVRPAWLLHGPKDHGHGAAADVLCRLFDTARAGPTRRISAGVSSAWGGRAVQNLAVGIGGSLEAGWRPKSMSELSAALGSALKQANVVLDLSDMEDYPGGLVEFRERFWLPLLENARVGGEEPHDLICLLQYRADIAPDDVRAVHEPDVLADGQVGRLPRLGEIQRQLLENWVRGLVSPDEVEDVMARAWDGGSPMPELVLARLSDPQTWRGRTPELATGDDTWQWDDD